MESRETFEEIFSISFSDLNFKLKEFNKQNHLWVA